MTWFMAPMEYNLNGKGIAAPKEYVHGVMLPVVFEEFEVAYIFSYFFLFIIIVDLHKANFSKNLGGGAISSLGIQFCRKKIKVSEASSEILFFSTAFPYFSIISRG